MPLPSRRSFLHHRRRPLLCRPCGKHRPNMWLCRQFCRLIQRICRQKAQVFNKITPERLKTVNHRCKRQAHMKSCARTATLHSSSLAEVETGCRRATTALWSGRSAERRITIALFSGNFTDVRRGEKGTSSRNRLCSFHRSSGLLETWPSSFAATQLASSPHA